jgi:hypothetical protein
MDLHHFDNLDPHQIEKSDPFPEPHQGEKSDPDPNPHKIKIRNWIRIRVTSRIPIRIKMMRIHNTA